MNARDIECEGVCQGRRPKGGEKVYVREGEGQNKERERREERRDKERDSAAMLVWPRKSKTIEN